MRLAIDSQAPVSTSRPDVLPAEVLAELDHGRCAAPFEWLGLHERHGQWQIVTLAHGAHAVEVIVEGNDKPVTAARMGEGVFVASLADRPDNYRLRLRWPHGREISADPYAFGPLLGQDVLDAFQRGELRRPADVLGAQL